MTHLNVCYIRLEDGRDVLVRVVVLAEDVEQAGLAAGPVPHHHQLLVQSHGHRDLAPQVLAF